MGVDSTRGSLTLGAGVKSTLRRHLWSLVRLVAAVYSPFYAAYFFAVYLELLPKEAADRLWGIFGGLLMPLANGWMVALFDEGYANGASRNLLLPAFSRARKAWTKLLTAYISISFILLGWLILSAGPVYLLLMLLKMQKYWWIAVPFGLVGGTFCLARFAFVDPLVLVEGLGPYAARHRSSELVRPRRTAVIAYGLATFLIPFALEIAGEFVDETKSGEWLPLLVEVLTGFLSSLLYVLPVVVFYVYYRQLVISDDAVLKD